jgi:hypothetical protein
MKIRTLAIGLAGSFALFAASCSDNSTSPAVVPPLTLPTSYDGSSYTTNAVVELQMRSHLQSLTTAMQQGRQLGVAVSAVNVATLYQPLRAITTPYYDTNVQGWLQELAKSSGGAYNPRVSPAENGQGGTFGGYLFDEHGLEMEQLVEKGLYAAALYNHALTVMNAQLTPASIDKIVAIFGASPAFKNTGSAPENPDVHAANYAARRDKNDGTGFYTKMRDQFIRAQAATKADSRYADTAQAALAQVRQLWEKSQAATVINYLYATITNISLTNPTDAQLGSALHAYGEGVGFLHGWRTLPADKKIITDAQIDQILTLMYAPVNGAPSSYQLVQNSFTAVQQLQQAITSLKNIYGFTDAELQDFRKNWVSEQGRK